LIEDWTIDICQSQNEREYDNFYLLPGNIGCLTFLSDEDFQVVAGSFDE
jgi:hypothetical protein